MIYRLIAVIVVLLVPVDVVRESRLRWLAEGRAGQVISLVEVLQLFVELARLLEHLGPLVAAAGGERLLGVDLGLRLLHFEAVPAEFLVGVVEALLAACFVFVDHEAEVLELVRVLVVVDQQLFDRAVLREMLSDLLLGYARVDALDVDLARGHFEFFLLGFVGVN